jgi:hypothetical protein
MDSRMRDIHSGKRFMLKDFIVVREGDGNFLVSPYYAEAGGTVLDWMLTDNIRSNHIQDTEEAGAWNERQVLAICMKFIKSSSVTPYLNTLLHPLPGVSMAHARRHRLKALATPMPFLAHGADHTPFHRLMLSSPISQTWPLPCENVR